MIPATALFVAAALTATNGLDAAQEAFARGDYPQAEQLALAQVQPPSAGAALYLIGLARFRSERFAAALDALERAWAESDRPASALWHFNRASCLYELGRFGEAQADYLTAASEDDALAVVSLIDAGFAALDGGSPSLAQTLADRAREHGVRESEAHLLADLDAHLATGRAEADAEYRAGLEAFDAGNYDEARRHFLRVSELDPSDGKSRIMSGASALHLGLPLSARVELEQAGPLAVDRSEREARQAYLEMLPGSGKPGWSGTAQLGAGVDSNALQTGFLEPNEFPGATSANTPSPFAIFDLGLGYRGGQGGDSGSLAPSLSYAFEQLAYSNADASDRSYQQHTILGALQLGPRADLTLGLSLGGEFAFTGLADFRPLQFSFTSAAWALLDESDRLSSRFELGYQRKQGQGGFDYLTGDRLDVALAQELRLGWAAFGLGYRFRAELIGTANQAIAQPPPEEVCPSRACTQLLVDPFGYLSNTAWLSSRIPVGQRLAFELSGGFEWRGYTSDNFVQIDRPDGSSSAIDRRRRHDTRAFASAGASYWLLPSLALSLRYDLLINQSDIDSAASDGGGQCEPPDFECHRLDAEVRSYSKHVVTLSCALSW